jgi:hypothetical protein
MPNGTVITLGAVGVLTAGAALSESLMGSAALDTSTLNYGGVTLELSTVAAGRIEDSMIRFGFHEMEATPGADELRSLVNHLRNMEQDKARRSRTKAAKEAAEQMVKDTAPLLELADALESIVRTKVPGTARQAEISRGDAIENTSKRSMYGVAPGERWLVESVGVGQGRPVRLNRLDSLDRRTGRELELRLRDIESLLAISAFTRHMGVK